MVRIRGLGQQTQDCRMGRVELRYETKASSSGQQIGGLPAKSSLKGRDRKIVAQVFPRRFQSRESQTELEINQCRPLAPSAEAPSRMLLL